MSPPSATASIGLTCSPEARELLPEDREATVVLKDDSAHKGTVAKETDDRIVLRTKRSETISTSRSYRKADIKSIEYTDLVPILAEKLLEIRLDEENSLPEEQYTSGIALFDEFVRKCPDAEARDAISERRSEFAGELEKRRSGLEKVEGEWLTAVCAAVRKFDVHTKKIDTLEKRPDFHGNEKVQEFHKKLVATRREIARELPKTMQGRVPDLIRAGEFDEAVSETTAFLHFWIDQVIESEGPASSVFREMDFDYILRMEKRIMDAYRNAGLGNRRPGRKPREKDMVYVPGGYFLMGKQGAGPGQRAFPMHIVFVSPFVIDKHEVSNKAYRKFVDYVKKSGDSSMEHPDAPPLKNHAAECWKKPSLSRDMQPVTGVDWFDAYAYASWIGKSLPTEAQWEKAARGMDARPYPWGERLPSKCAISSVAGRALVAAEMDRQNPPQPPEPPSGFGCGCVKEKDLPPPPPTRLPAVPFDVDKHLPERALVAARNEVFEWDREYPSAYGLIHMAGNAAEWVLDWYHEEYYGESPVRDPQGPGEGKCPVFRGGSYLDSKDDQFSAHERGVASHARLKSGCDYKTHPMIGFRCAKNLDIVKTP